MNIGAASSVSAYVTPTTKVSCAIFPAASMAVHVTGVMPTGKNDPEYGLHDTVSTPTLSEAEGSAK